MALPEKLCREARRLQIEGKVQGVGFRPFVYRLAHKFGLSGQVANGEGGVVVEIEGTPRFLEAFTAALTKEAPPLAAFSRISIEKIPPRGLTAFTIASTGQDRGSSSPIPLPADTATCRECFAEVMQAGERRHRPRVADRRVDLLQPGTRLLPA